PAIVVDSVTKAATHNARVISLHSLLTAYFYREGARVTPAPRRLVQRRARRRLTPAPWLVPVTPDVQRRLSVIAREWQRIDPKFLDEDEQRFWATIAGRQIRFDERAEFARKLTDRGASKACLEQFLTTCAAENPNRRLRMTALSDRVSMTVERADFDDLVNTARELPVEVGVALLASAEGYTPRANQLLEAAREKIATLPEIAQALAENLPAPKAQPSRSRRRRRRKRKGAGQNGGQQPQEQQQNVAQPASDGTAPPPKPRRRQRRRSGSGNDAPGAEPDATSEAAPEAAA